MAAHAEFSAKPYQNTTYKTLVNYNPSLYVFPINYDVGQTLTQPSKKSESNMQKKIYL